MNTQEKVLELVEMAAAGEIDYQPHALAILDFGRRVNLQHETENWTEWESIFIDFLHEKYADGSDFTWSEFLEEIGLAEEWQEKKAFNDWFNAKYGLKGFDDEQP